MNPRFLVGSSYYIGDKPQKIEFSRIWAENLSLADIQPTRTVIIAEGGSQRIMVPFATDVVHLTGDLGSIGRHLSGEKTHEFTGWSATMCACAMMAYADEADFIYREEDALAFGGWVRQMYEDMGDGDMVFGAKHTSAPWQVCSQSLFLVRHSFLPAFVSAYLALGKDGDRDNIGELKFQKLEAKFGKQRLRRLSFGCDRERPIPWDSPVFYFQQATPEELDEARRRGFIS